MPKIKKASPSVLYILKMVPVMDDSLLKQAASSFKMAKLQTEVSYSDQYGTFRQSFMSIMLSICVQNLLIESMLIIHGPPLAPS